MSEPLVVFHTIGQTPRPDLMRDLESRFDSVARELVGALDDLPREQIPEPGPDGYPLETRLRDGSRVVVDAEFVESRLQESIAEWEGPASVHVILCAGPFPRLVARGALLIPMDVAVRDFTGWGLSALEVVVPFAAQELPAAEKWCAAGFICRTHVFADKPESLPVSAWLDRRIQAADPSGVRSGEADAVVFDYVGFPSKILDPIAAAIDLPVFDLGRLSFDALERTLAHAMRPDR